MLILIPYDTIPLNAKGDADHEKSKSTITLYMLPHLDTDLDKIDYKQLASKEHRKEFKESDAYNKYVLPVLEREKRQKKLSRKNWWKNNWIQLLSLIFSFIAALPVIIQAVCYILTRLM